MWTKTSCKLNYKWTAIYADIIKIKKNKNVIFIRLKVYKIYKKVTHHFLQIETSIDIRSL